jgi:hypothetical protein
MPRNLPENALSGRLFLCLHRLTPEYLQIPCRSSCGTGERAESHGRPEGGCTRQQVAADRRRRAFRRRLPCPRPCLPRPVADANFPARAAAASAWKFVVPLAGLEPARPCGQQILSLPRLPIPPQGHRAVRQSGRHHSRRFPPRNRQAGLPRFNRRAADSRLRSSPLETIRR